MKRHVFAIVLLLLASAGIWESQIVAQEVPASVTPPAEHELRYQFLAHEFSVNGTDQEIYLKLDCYTGKTWRYHASNGRWTKIPEPAKGLARDPDTQNRYALVTHDYLDTYGEEQELVMRVDKVSGFSWTYRGASGSWKDVESDQ